VSQATAPAHRPVPRPLGRSLRCVATPDRLIDAAEWLFAEHGFEGTSMRALADRAGTGVSAANYHFGGKLGVVRAVLERRLAPINARRLADLAALERACAPGLPRLDVVLEAFLRPSFEAWLQAEAEAGAGRGGRHIEARLHTDPHPRLAELKEALCRPVVDRYVATLARILPEQSRAELRTGIQLVSGLLVHVVGGQVPLDAVAAASAERPAATLLLERLVAFSAAGLRTASPATAGRDAPTARRSGVA